MKGHDRVSRNPRRKNERRGEATDPEPEGRAKQASLKQPEESVTHDGKSRRRR